jgi:hypothetical protein
MVRKGLVVLGLVGAVLIATVVGVLRIRSLEERVASLERTGRGPVISPPVTAVNGPGLNLNWGPAGDLATVQVPEGSTLPNGLPKGTTPHEFNGMTYYVIPLADNGGTTSQR